MECILTNDHQNGCGIWISVSVVTLVGSSRRQGWSFGRRYSCIEDDQCVHLCSWRMINGKELIEGRVEVCVGCEIIGIGGPSVGPRVQSPINKRIVAFTGYRRISGSFVYDAIQRSFSNKSKCTFRKNISFLNVLLARLFLKKVSLEIIGLTKH